MEEGTKIFGVGVEKLQVGGPVQARELLAARSAQTVAARSHSQVSGVAALPLCKVTSHTDPWSY